MPIDNVLLMKEARETLKGKWGLAVGGSFLYLAITIIVGAPDDVGPILGLLIDGPMLLGLSVFSLALARKQEASISQLFLGFNDFVRTFAAYLFMGVFTLLWLLLLIVPGIIAAYSYSQTFFILAEDKSISARNAIKKSKAMMKGNKKRLFFLSLRFLGWLILCIPTLGIGLLWLMPYFHVTMAMFYDSVSGKSAPQHAPSNELEK
ncbi:DUF975 family protein [Candidatus Nomurabacteria bacterium]|nr:DUF975 family protein [Candidatus Nomurabacteria bacterium]